MQREAVVAVYRPRPGREGELVEVLREHVPLLRREGLAAQGSWVVLRSRADGAVMEVFCWVSGEAAERAHGHPDVQELWGRIEEVAEVGTLGSLQEAGQTFCHFEVAEGLGD